MNQVHGSDVVEVDSNSTSPVTADALITRETGLPLVVLTADCLPILISSRSVVGVIHAGRKGVLNGIIGKTVNQMRQAGAQYLVATIGPAICKNCYEVSPEMYEEVVSAMPELATSVASHSLDLLAAAKVQLKALEVQATSVDICTAHNENFFSYRRDGKTGRNAGAIVL